MGKKRKTTWKEKREQAKKPNTSNQHYPSQAMTLENKALEAYYKVTLLCPPKYQLIASTER